MQRVPAVWAWKALMLLAVASAVAVAGFLVAPRTSHAAPLASERCIFIILAGHSDTKSHTYTDSDTVTVHSQLYESEDNVTGDYCGQLESITTISDNGRGAPLYGWGGNELIYRQTNGQYGGVGGGYYSYSNNFALQPIIETTACAAPGGSFAPKDGEPAINTGAANYCPPQ